MIRSEMMASRCAMSRAVLQEVAVKFFAWIAGTIRSLFSPEAAARRSVASFWRWFARHESSLFEFEKNQERLLRMLPYALQAVHRNLTFEIGPVKEGRR